VLREVKLIAEPWDLGPGGYQLGRFPPLWAEWNDKFRETVRSFWLASAAESSGVRDLAYRLSGSSDLYRDDGRRPYASINYVTSHDGLTLADLVEASGANDGERRARALAATTLLATGVPMWLAGDEIGRTQDGDPNAYDVDDPTSWLRWAPDPTGLHDLVRQVLALRREQPALRQRHFFDGRPRAAAPRRARPLGFPVDDQPVDKDLAWLTTAGTEMRVTDWDDHRIVTLGVLFDGDHLGGTDVLVWLHTGGDDVEVTLPPDRRRRQWTRLLDTARRDPGGPAVAVPAGGRLTLPAASVVVLGRD
jgi:glycogen operon protein